jgi:hypothetical protein
VIEFGILVMVDPMFPPFGRYDGLRLVVDCRSPLHIPLFIWVQVDDEGRTRVR